MKLSQRMEDAINRHINAELSSAYLYLSMSAYCDSVSMPGFAHWMRVQHREETSHAMKLFDFIHDRGGRVVLDTITQPPIQFNSVLDVAEQTLEHERSVTSMIYRLYELAVEESDYATQVLLQWFINEQVEEETIVTEVVDQLKLVDNDGTGLLMIDARLSGRDTADDH